MRTYNPLLIIVAILGFLTVAIGAFAAHGLKSVLSSQALSWVDTGVQYQMFHTLALMVIAFVLIQWPQWRQLVWSSGCFIVGIILFSGSLYAMALTGNKAFAWLTPLGGMAFLLGWGTLLWAALSRQNPLSK